MIKRSEDLSQQEIDILDNLSWMFKEGLIDANANIISGKEEELITDAFLWLACNWGRLWT